MDEDIVLGREGHAIVTIGPPSAPAGPDYLVCAVTVIGPGVRAESSLEFAQDWGRGWQGLVDYFEVLAADWRGWDGARTWSDDHANVVLTAGHDRVGTVTLTVELKPQSGLGWADSWSLTIVVETDPGSLSEIADQLRRMTVRAD